MPAGLDSPPQEKGWGLRLGFHFWVEPRRKTWIVLASGWAGPAVPLSAALALLLVALNPLLALADSVAAAAALFARFLVALLS